MTVDIVLLPFDKVPEKYKTYGNFGISIYGVFKREWDEAYKFSINGDLFSETEYFDIEGKIVYVQDEEGDVSFWAPMEGIDIKKTKLPEKVMLYLLNCI